MLSQYSAPNYRFHGHTVLILVANHGCARNTGTGD